MIARTHGLLLLVLLAAACGESAVPEADAGADTIDAALPCVAPLERMGNSSIPAALGCVGSRFQPERGETNTLPLRVQDFQTSGVLADFPVEVFFDNRLRSQCMVGDPNCATFTTDAQGRFVPPLGTTQWFAYRVRNRAGATRGALTTVGVNRSLPAALQQLSESTARTLYPLAGQRERVPGTAVLAGGVYSCTGAAIENISVRLYIDNEVGNGQEVRTGTAATDTFLSYFQGDFPDPLRTGTNTNGLFASGNLRIGGEGGTRIRVEAVSRTPGATCNETIIACEEAILYPDTLTLLNLDPARDDYDASSGCARHFGTDGGVREAGVRDAAVRDSATDALVDVRVDVATSDAGADVAAD